MQETGLVKNLFKSRKYILEHLEFSGYDVEKYENTTVTQIDVMFKNNQLDILVENDKRKKKCYVKYHLGKSLRKQDIHKYMDELYINPTTIAFEEKDDLVIVSNIPANTTIIDELKTIWSTYGYYIRVICIDNLLYNMFDHEYVPKHFVMSESETLKLMKQYNIDTLKKLPEISRFDAAALCIGLRPNEVCKIVRPSKTSIESLYYRVCVN